MDTCDELITAICALSEKSVFDYLIAIGPIVLSLIAIFISICTTAKQNRIALFEKRFCVLEIIKRIIWLSGTIAYVDKLHINDEEERAIIKKSYQVCAAYNSMFRTNLDYVNAENRDRDIFSIISTGWTVEKDLMMAEYLFYPGISALLIEMSDAMIAYMIDTISWRDNSLSGKQFCEKCSEFETKWLPKLEKKTQITKGSKTYHR